MAAAARHVVAHCPHCNKGYTVARLKNLRARANNAVAHLEDKENKDRITVPCFSCEKPIAYQQINSMWAAYSSEQRTTFGAGTGRPKGAIKQGVPRCFCGAMTLTRALARFPTGLGKCGPDCAPAKKRPKKKKK